MFTRKTIYLVLISLLTMNQLSMADAGKQKSPILSRKEKIAKSAGAAVALVSSYLSASAYYSLYQANKGISAHKAQELRSQYDGKQRKGINGWFDGPSPKLLLQKDRQELNDRLWKTIPATLVGVAFFYWGHKQGNK
jgi:hypothetical protein